MRPSYETVEVVNEISPELGFGFGVIKYVGPTNLRVPRLSSGK